MYEEFLTQSCASHNYMNATVQFKKQKQNKADGSHFYLHATPLGLIFCTKWERPTKGLILQVTARGDGLILQNMSWLLSLPQGRTVRGELRGHPVLPPAPQRLPAHVREPANSPGTTGTGTNPSSHCQVLEQQMPAAKEGLIGLQGW